MGYHQVGCTSNLWFQQFPRTWIWVLSMIVGIFPMGTPLDIRNLYRELVLKKMEGFLKQIQNYSVAGKKRSKTRRSPSCHVPRSVPTCGVKLPSSSVETGSVMGIGRM